MKLKLIHNPQPARRRAMRPRLLRPLIIDKELFKKRLAERIAADVLVELLVRK